MQDIVFYATANETFGTVRDYANVRTLSAPVLTLGVSVCLKMRLFADMESTSTFPIASFSGIADWKWSMDGDFNRSTTCKLVADADEISVHTVTDMIDGETMSFTEIVIPISNMNTQELAAWLGNEKTKSGLTGELVGYDSDENAVFVLQIEDFTVRNRVAGLADPTALDQEIVSHAQAEQMIQSAVSSSAATKQDNLTSANAGVGISISSSGILSVADIPQSAVTGLTSDLAGKQDKLTIANGGTGISVSNDGIICVSAIPQNSVTGLVSDLAGKQSAITAGYRMALVSGSTVDQSRYFAVEPSITAPANQTTTVVLSAGKAYEIHAVGTNAKVVLNRENPPSERTFGLDGRMEIFVANTGYIKTGSNVVLANALEPDAVNNCTVRFHDGLAIISVEDHIAGYIVVSAAGSTAGTLPYALTSATQEYIAFDASLNGQTLDMGGAITNKEKHVVGNGYTQTVISGGVSCTSKTTFSNLSMNGVVFSDGTGTLGDVFIPNGATVSVSGGGLAIEKVTGSGGTVDLGQTRVTLDNSIISGCTFTNGYTSSTNGGGALYVPQSKTAIIHDCNFSGNSGKNGAAIAVRYNGAYALIDGCVFTDNTHVGTATGAVVVRDYASATVQKCTFNENEILFAGSDGTVVLAQSNTLFSVTGSGAVIVSSGAILDLTGNTNNPALNPGGGVTFESGGATVYPSAGSASAYMLGGMTVPQIGNTNVVNLNNTNVVIGSGSTAYASGCTFSGGSATNGGAFSLSGAYNSFAEFVAESCDFIDNNATSQGGAVHVSKGNAAFSSCTFSGNTAANALRGYAVMLDSGSLVIKDCSFGDAQTIAKNNIGNGSITLVGSNRIARIVPLVASSNNCSCFISSGAILDLTGNTVSAPVYLGTGGDITISSGGITIIDSGGTSHEFQRLAITGSTITKLGEIYGATVYVPAYDPEDFGLGPWNIYTTLGSSEVSTGEQPQEIVIEGGLVGIEEN